MRGMGSKFSQHLLRSNFSRGGVGDRHVGGGVGYVFRLFFLFLRGGLRV